MSDLLCAERVLVDLRSRKIQVHSSYMYLEDRVVGYTPMFDHRRVTTRANFEDPHHHNHKA